MLLGPAGFAMGFPFPIGMLAFGAHRGACLLAVNGAASVLASVFSLALAIVAGFFMTAVVGAALYAAAYLLVRRELVGESYDTAGSAVSSAESEAARAIVAAGSSPRL
jgi:hypothetical protein